VLDEKRCTGIRYSVAGDLREARVGREVVVSAGTACTRLPEVSRAAPGMGLREKRRNNPRHRRN
jgi:hypothetical protein